MSLQVFGFILLVAVIATLLSGTLPALLIARSGVNETLKEGGSGGGSGSGSNRLRDLLVVSEISLAMVALIGAGLFYRSFKNASGIDPGVDRKNISLSQFCLSNAGYFAERFSFIGRRLRRP